MRKQDLSAMRPLRISFIAGLLFLLAAPAAFAAPVLDFRDLVKSAGPAVVNINTERTERMRGLPPGAEMFRGMPNMERFFDQFEEFQGGPRTRRSNSLGSGFFISADGYIVTNNHVIEEADVIRVYVQAEGDYVMLFTPAGRFLKEQTMRWFEEHLPDRFVRIHRSCIVDVDRIARVELFGKETYRVRLQDGTVLKASVNGYRQLKFRLDL